MEELTMSEIATSPPQQTVEQVEIIIDPEFESMLPPKTHEQYEALKEAIRSKGGVRDPVVVWEEESILLDGHHRHRICKELGIKPPIDRMSFKNREDAKMWVVKNQLADRRNLNPFQSVELVLKSKAIFATKAKANQQAGVSLKSGEGVDAGAELAKLAGVSPDTVRKVERILEKAHCKEVAKAIDALRNGDADISISSVFKKYCTTKAYSLSVEFDGKRWQKNIAKMQANFAIIEDFPSLYHDCFDLVQSQEQEAMLNTMCGQMVDAVRRLEARLQRDDETDYSEVKRLMIDMVVDKFGAIDDLCQHNEKELDEESRDKLIVNCKQFIREATAVIKRIRSKHGISVK